MKSVILIAFHFPPVQVSSGLQRTLANANHLPENGWQPLVLSAHPRAYAVSSDSQMGDIATGTTVKRAFALDTCRHLSFRGKYPGLLALPDRWVSWWIGGVVAGLRLARSHKPRLIWSTYPIATAHLIGLTLHKITGLPWVADFRDSMTEDDYPPDPRKHKIYSWIERKTIKHCMRAVFTTPSALRMYAERYPDEPAEKWALIPNGYNEDIFVDVEQSLSEAGVSQEQNQQGPVILLHSGVIYPQERDPEPFFEAIASLCEAGMIDDKRLQIVLRASGHEDLFQAMLMAKNIQHIVRLEPIISYREALAEILAADGLLILQAANCNHQVPAKVYEYFRARKPILALTDAAGDTAAILKDAGLTDIAPLDDSEEISKAIMHFVTSLETGKAGVANDEAVNSSSRTYGVSSLGAIFDSLL